MSNQSTSEAVEMDVIKEHDSKPSTAPEAQTESLDDESAENRKSLFRRSTGSKKRYKRARMPSSSSLHSLVSILKPNSNSDQRSAPNVSFGEDYNDINIDASKNSLSVNLNPSIGESSSQFQIDGDESFRVPGGSFSTQTSTIGFRASFFSVLEKLGVWRSQDLYKTPPVVIETKFPSDRKKSRNSVTSLYFRTLYGGKYPTSIYNIFFYRIQWQLVAKHIRHFELECETKLNR